MDPRTQERVERWDSRPFSDGYDGLSDLADTGFSGAVSAAGTWLFVLNGRIVGVFEGDIEDIDGSSGTVYQAPHPSLSLLCSMEERGGETRAQYYTNDTPLEEVDQTLQDGSFTGYVVLSENVLSGDYYAVYYGGRRMAAAYIGNAERLLTGDEAFDRAVDEVGIYEVKDVDIEVTDVPETGGTDTSASNSTDATADDSAAGMSPTGSDPGEVGDRGSKANDETASVPHGERTSVSDDETASSDAVAPSSVEETTRAESQSESVDDPPTGIEPIDISDDESAASSSIEGITGGESLIDESEPDGITTATDPTAESTSESPDEESADGVDEGIETGDGRETEVATGSAAGSASPSSDDDEFAETDVSPSETDPERAPPDGDDSATLDPAEVEAAAAELEESEISWQEDDESTGDGTATPSDHQPAKDAVATEPRSKEPEQRSIESPGESGAPGDDEPDAPGDDEPDATGDDEPGTLGDDEPNTAGEVGSDTVGSDVPKDGAEGEDGHEQRFDEEAQWRETRRIPSIDPEKTRDEDDGGADPSARDDTASAGGAVFSASTPADDGPSGDRSSDDSQQRRPSSQQSSTQQSERSTSSAGGPASAQERSSRQQRDRSTDRLEARIDDLEAERDQILETAEQLEAERDQLRAETQDLAGRVQQLQARIDELESELESARAGEDAGSADQTSTQLSPTEALSRTNLFVRYDSKSNPTLETAHQGNADREEVASNLRLEHHTEFDAADVAVAGQPYDDFLTSTMAHRFVDWLTEDLLYEIRDTGHADRLSDLYDTIPRIDRAELQSTISLAEDDTEDVPDEVTFDVVAYDKMGNPLALVTLADSREPATKETLAELEEAASAVKANYPELASAIAVTSSYFDPGALEVTEQATSGSLLSRSSKSSYVNLSRKQGYHLCLVESRSEGFHMTVPEL